MNQGGLITSVTIHSPPQQNNEAAEEGINEKEKIELHAWLMRLTKTSNERLTFDNFLLKSTTVWHSGKIQEDWENFQRIRTCLVGCNSPRGVA